MLDGIRWVLFDAVGTLIYPDPPVADAYHAAAQQFGSRLAVEEISQRFAAALAASHNSGLPTSERNERRRWQHIVKQVIDDVVNSQDELFERLWQHFAQPQHWRPYADVAETVHELLRRGYRFGIASNFDSRLLRIVSGHPALSACESVFVSSEVGYAKPDPRFFRAIEGKLGVEPGQIALVGDDEVADVQGAMAAGWRAIRLDRVGKSLDSITIRSLAQLQC